jgi:OOP family OmpA-OmpF porin
MLNDTDKDGVADYLDRENNSIAGVTVDSRGIMVDMNKNGVPDELEKYFDQRYGNLNGTGSAITTEGGEVIKPKKSTDFIKKSINDGYVSVFYDTNKTKPSSLSVDNINYILIYMKNNPSANLEIIGHADEVGDSKSNDKLAYKRAVEVKNILLKSGIEEERLIISSNGEDNSVDVNSSFTRSLVRRVTFKIN